MLNKCFTSLRLKLEYNYTLFEKYIINQIVFKIGGSRLLMTQNIVMID